MRKKNVTAEMMVEYIETSLFVLLKKKNFPEITIGEIAEKAGLNRTTFYRHFKSKEEVVFKFYDSLLDDFIEEKGSKAPNLRRYLQQMFEHFNKSKEDLLLLHNNNLSLFLLDVLNKKFDNADLKMPTKERYKITFHVGGLFNCLQLWFSREMKDSPRLLVDACDEILDSKFEPYLLKRTQNKLVK